MAFVQNPNPYVWKRNEKGPDGVPYVKKAPVVLQKGKVTKDFLTQEDVNVAWATGWHDTKRPETADVVPEAPKEEDEVDVGAVTPMKLFGKTFQRLTKQELMEYGIHLGLEIDPELTNEQMKGVIRDFRAAMGTWGDDGTPPPETDEEDEEEGEG